MTDSSKKTKRKNSKVTYPFQAENFAEHKLCIFNVMSIMNELFKAYFLEVKFVHMQKQQHTLTHAGINKQDLKGKLKSCYKH